MMKSSKKQLYTYKIPSAKHRIYIVISKYKYIYIYIIHFVHLFTATVMFELDLLTCLVLIHIKYVHYWVFVFINMSPKN